MARNYVAIALLLICAALVLAALYVYGNDFTYAKPGGNPYTVGTITLHSNNLTVLGNVYLALTLPQQEAGLMNASSIGSCNGEGDCVGMLFVFNGTQELCFWMKNTIMPLRQVWIAANGTVVNIYNATPQSTASVCYDGEMVLEVPANSTLPLGLGARIAYS